MPRNTESYTTTHQHNHQAGHQAGHPDDHPTELTDWHKQQAAEKFLESLDHHNPKLAQEFTLAARDASHTPSWLSTKRQESEHVYDSLRLAMENLNQREKDYVSAEAASTLIGTTTDRAVHNAAQPPSHVLQGEDPPEFRVSYDPDGYNKIMEHLQKDMEAQASDLHANLHSSLNRSDRYNFLDNVAKLQGLHHNLRALEAGEPPTVINMEDRHNRENYLDSLQSRGEDLLNDYTSSIQLDYPELTPQGTPPAAKDLLTDPQLRDKFEWFTQAYDLMPADARNLAWAIHAKAVTDADTQSKGDKIQVYKDLQKHRDSLYQKQDTAQ